MKTYSSYTADIPRIINNSLADNITWGMEVIIDSIRYLTTKYYFNERTYTTLTVSNQQFYNLPPQVKKIINVTVTIGTVKWSMTECPSREFWDRLNVIPYQQDFPAYFFVYNGQVGIFPTPASAGNTITINYKTRIKDLSMTDVTQTNTISVTTNTTTVTSSTTTFYAWMAGNWLRIPFNATVDSANGDNQWYQISSVTSGTQVALMNPYTGPTVASGAITIGEAPILPEDYQDLPLYRMGLIYYTTRFPDPVRADQYQKLWDTGETKLNEEFGSKTVSVVLPDTDSPFLNPNLFQRQVS